jgi:hypothetical protein
VNYLENRPRRGTSNWPDLRYRGSILEEADGFVEEETAKESSTMVLPSAGAETVGVRDDF